MVKLPNGKYWCRDCERVQEQSVRTEPMMENSLYQIRVSFSRFAEFFSRAFFSAKRPLLGEVGVSP